MTQLKRTITFCGNRRLIACDGRCEKAWGIGTRPRVQLDPENVDDYAFLADDELGLAPADPGTYEGDQPKPSPDQKLESKWCSHQCERSVIVDCTEDVVLPDLSRRRYNRAPHTREGQEFTPRLPPHWEPVIGTIPISIHDDLTWDEDLYLASWNEWAIWIDGGKGISTWQCSLVEPNSLTPEGVLERDHRYLMRDFLDTSEQVQAWLDRAVVVARLAHEGREPEVTQPSQPDT